MSVNISIPRDNDRVPMINSYNYGTSGFLLTTGTNTALAFSSVSIPCRAIAVYAYTTNRNTVAVGMDTNILAESASGTRTGKGEQLVQGASTYIYATDAANAYLTSVVNGDGVSFVIYY